MFIRVDLPVEHQIIQSNHAVYHLASLRQQDEGVPNLVLIGLPGQKALRKVLSKLSVNNIPHYAWEEPDNDWGLTAIATAPITGEQRETLRNYRVYNTRVAQLVERRGLLAPEVAGSIPAPRTNPGDSTGSRPVCC